MKKSDMSARQLKDRAAFRKALGPAGWDFGGWDALFEGGADLDPEAQAEKRNRTFDMRLSLYAAERYLLLELTQRRGPVAVVIRLYPAASLGRLLDAIVSRSDAINSTNYADSLRELSPHCGRMLLETTKGLLKLT